MKINFERVLKNLKKVLKKKDINLLSKEAYEVVMNLSGFIAHYDINGFKAYYSDFDDFLRNLRNSHDLLNPNYYLDEFFMKDNKEYYTAKAKFLKKLKEVVDDVE